MRGPAQETGGDPADAARYHRGSMSDPALETVDSRIGTTLADRYRIDRQIGEGGMGLVYAGEHLLIKRKVAIKMLKPEFSQDQEILGRFRREAIAATSIGNPHIIEVLDMGVAPDGAVFMVLEFLEGRDWAAELDRVEKQPLAQVIHILRQVCDGLQAAHDKGIIHRDLKCENVFLTTRGNDRDFAKILDFGISKILTPEGVDPKQFSLTRTAAAIGTPSSMPPEQLRGARDVDHRVDIWAVGVMMHRALTGHYPFDGETYPVLAAKILTESHPALAVYRSDLPPDAQRLVDRMLAKDRNDRFDSARALSDALAKLGSGAPQVYETAPLADRLANLEKPVARPHSAVRVARRRGGFPWIAAALAALVIAALVVGVALALPYLGEPSRTSERTPEPAPPAPEETAEELPVVPDPPAEPAMVPIRIEVTPSTAALSLDGETITNPYQGEVERGDELHRLEARASGHATTVREFTATGPVAIAFVLETERRNGRNSREVAVQHAETEMEEPAMTDAPLGDVTAMEERDDHPLVSPFGMMDEHPLRSPFMM